MLNVILIAAGGFVLYNWYKDFQRKSAASHLGETPQLSTHIDVVTTPDETITIAPVPPITNSAYHVENPTPYQPANMMVTKLPSVTDMGVVDPVASPFFSGASPGQAPLSGPGYGPGLQEAFPIQHTPEVSSSGMAFLDASGERVNLYPSYYDEDLFSDSEYFTDMMSWSPKEFGGA